MKMWGKTGALHGCQWLYLRTGVGGREYFIFCFYISALSFQLEYISVSLTSFKKKKNTENKSLKEIPARAW
jgi:hypothetical protein